MIHFTESVTHFIDHNCAEFSTGAICKGAKIALFACGREAGRDICSCHHCYFICKSLAGLPPLFPHFPSGGGFIFHILLPQFISFSYRLHVLFNFCLRDSRGYLNELIYSFHLWCLVLYKVTRYVHH